jgi:3-oxoadipate enol-lactonase
MPHVDVNGLKMYYEEVGTGEPLLLISGLGATRMSWATVTPVLKDTYRCITFDNRGVGRTEVTPGPYTIKQMADDTAALINLLGIGPVNTVGWSMGGVILQSLLIDHPEVVNKAVMLSTLPSYTDVQHAWLDGLLALRQAGVDPVVLGTIGMPWGFTPYAVTDHVALFEMIKLSRQDPEPTSYEGFAAQAQAIREFDRRPELSGVQTETLVLVGAEDVLTPPSQSIEISERMPNATLNVLPRGSHGMIIEFPTPTIGAIARFLAG